MKRKGKILRISGIVLAILGGLAIAGVGVVTGAKTIARNRSIDTNAAKVFCLADAQVTEDEVLHLEIGFERRGMQYVYQVEFDTDDGHYDYVLNALDGTVISRQPAELPIKKPAEKSGTSRQPETADTEGEQASRTYITVDQAKQTAVLDSGNTIFGVNFSEAKLEEDDNRIKYEIEFYTDTMEYEYDIDPWSGRILSASAERLYPDPALDEQDLQTHSAYQKSDSASQAVPDHEEQNWESGRKTENRDLYQDDDHDADDRDDADRDDDPDDDDHDDDD